MSESKPKVKNFEAKEGKYLLDGKEIDMAKDTKTDEAIRRAITIYMPATGEYLYHEEEGTFSPVGERAGGGDTGLLPGQLNRNTNSPVHNSVDGVDRS